MKKLLFTLLLVTAAVSFAQQDTVECVVPNENATNGITINALVGQKWPLSDQAAWYGKARAIIPVGAEVFGQQLFAMPEFGISSETLEAYGGASFSIDGPYAGFILTGRRTASQPFYLTIEASTSFQLTQ